MYRNGTGQLLFTIERIQIDLRECMGASINSDFKHAVKDPVHNLRLWWILMSIYILFVSFA